MKGLNDIHSTEFNWSVSEQTRRISVKPALKVEATLSLFSKLNSTITFNWD